MDTTTLVTSPYIQGNIGSCEVKTTSLSKDSWHNTTIAVNSCTGEVIQQNTYYDYSYIYYPIMLIVVVFFIGLIIRIFSDY